MTVDAEVVIDPAELVAALRSVEAAGCNLEDTDHAAGGLRDPDRHAGWLRAYHGYPWLIHRLTYRRTNHRNLHVRGYKEEGTTTTPFDMLMLNDMDRFHLVMDVIDRVPGLGARMAHLRQQMVDERLRHRALTRAVSDDPPDVRDAPVIGRP